MGEFAGHYDENGDQDPRGNGPNPGGHHHGQDLSRECPLCGADVARSLADHLPCEEDGS